MGGGRRLQARLVREEGGAVHLRWQREGSGHTTRSHPLLLCCFSSILRRRECCSWDSNTANGVALASDGPAAFARGAARGSWLATFGLAGHTSLILEPGSSVFGGVTCPTVLEPRFLLPDSATLAAAFLEARLRAPNAGTEQHALAWAAARPPAHLTLAIKGAAV